MIREKTKRREKKRKKIMFPTAIEEYRRCNE